MAKLTDLALATVGLLTVAAYSGLLLRGALPEQALALALGGGLTLGVLASLAVHLVEGGPHPPPLPSGPLLQGEPSLSIEDREGRDRGGAPPDESPAPSRMERGRKDKAKVGHPKAEHA